MAFAVAFALFLIFTGYYQVGMLIELDNMDVLEITKKGWSFGQIAAVTVWVPVVVEYACEGAREKLQRSGWLPR